MSSEKTKELSWNKLRSETRAAYNAFKLYRDYGWERSLAKTFRKLKSIPADQPVSVPGKWNDWSKRHQWGARCDAFDAHEDAIEQAERSKQLTKLVGQRADFEIETQRRKQNRILGFDVVLDKYQQEAALSIRDLTQEKTITEIVDGKPKTTHTVTRFRAIKGGDMAKIAKVQSELEAQAINGLREQAKNPDEVSVTQAQPKAIIPEWLVQDLRSQAEVAVHLPDGKAKEPAEQFQ